MFGRLVALLRPGGLSLAVLLLAAGATRAELITYQFTGEIKKVHGKVLDGLVAPGSTFTGTFTYSDKVKDLIPGKTIGFYPGAARDIRLLVDGLYDFGLSSYGASKADDGILLYNAADASGFLLSKGHFKGEGSDFDPVFRTQHAGVLLHSPEAGALSSTKLKGLTLDLEAFTDGIHGLRFTGTVGKGGDFAFTGRITSLTKVMETPEPASLALLALGLGGLALARRWKQ